ncbi:HNH endonuclease [Sphingomonas cannabina]|uniref:HNH endonuclease n=1 Tax=Sphingomonas cannabina TaxID=2899123 RepID=UPI001F2547D3|nr:HNH endonuclease [Sphingomonas cannabina]UIJ43757.1 HNH endonuclease [Sphingomonas cannabina]
MAGIVKPNSITVMDDRALIDVAVPSYPDAIAVIDVQDIEIAVDGRCRWRAARSGRGRRPYVVRREGREWQSLHRLIVGDVPHGMVVDHIDGNPLNNRRANLRIVTPRQNSYNFAPTAGRLLPKGVKKHRNRFEARIQVNRKALFLGSYPTPELASEAYQRAARHYFGEMARVSALAPLLDDDEATELREYGVARIEAIKG